MVYENIRITHSNFCIGPQAGTYCYVDTSDVEAIMRVKNSSGDLITSYAFYPANILEQDSAVYPYKTVESLKYIGPINLAGFYNGLPFYTLERVNKQRTIVIRYDLGSGLPIFGTESYSDECIIRKWLLNTNNTRLELYSTITKTNTNDYYYDCHAMVIENIQIAFGADESTGTGEIEVTDSSGLEKYDVIMLGPSNDTDNLGAVEYVYVYSIVGNDVEIKTYEPGVPPLYEYVSGDPITVFKDIFLFSDGNVTDDVTETSDVKGMLYRLDALDYGAVLETNQSGMYRNINAADWNNTYQALSFVYVNNLLTLDVTDYEVFKSHVLTNIEDDKYTIFPVYDIDFDANDVYRLQRKISKRDDSGDISTTTWSTYNYHEDTILPYSASITIYVYPAAIVLKQKTVTVKAVVRDQFGVGLLGKDVQFYKNGDIGASFVPIDGKAVTNSDGIALITYTSGQSFTGMSTISARAVGSNISTGSQYVWDKIYLQTYYEYVVDHNFLKQMPTLSGTWPTDGPLYSEMRITQLGLLPPAKISLICYNKLQFPGGHWIGLIKPDSDATSVRQVLLPIFNKTGGGSTPPDIYIQLGQYHALYQRDHTSEFKPKLGSDDLTNFAGLKQKGSGTNDLQLSQTYISRHLLTGHKDDVDINQFKFVENAIPAFWSEKNSIITNIWIRLRPYAFSLDPNTLVFKIRETSYAGDTGWQDITLEGTITLFDAGAGLNGIEFNWDQTDFFHHNAVVYVSIIIYDKAVIPNLIITDYWFRIIPDYKAPYLDNLSPMREEYDVPVDTDINFDILDVGSGVDINKFEMYVNSRAVNPSIIKISDVKYSILYNTSKDFVFGETIEITIKATDLSKNKNMLYDMWRFYIIGSTGPWFDRNNYEPGLCKKGVYRYSDDISLQVYGVNGTGVDADSILVHIGGKERNVRIIPIIYRSA